MQQYLNRRNGFDLTEESLSSQRGKSVLTCKHTVAPFSNRNAIRLLSDVDKTSSPQEFTKSACNPRISVWVDKRPILVAPLLQRMRHRKKAAVGLDDVVVFYKLHPATGLEEMLQFLDVAWPPVFLETGAYASRVDQIIMIRLICGDKSVVQVPDLAIKVVRFVWKIRRIKVKSGHL